MSIVNTQAKCFGFFIWRLGLDNWDKQKVVRSLVEFGTCYFVKSVILWNSVRLTMWLLFCGMLLFGVISSLCQIWVNVYSLRSLISFLSLRSFLSYQLYSLSSLIRSLPGKNCFRSCLWQDSAIIPSVPHLFHKAARRPFSHDPVQLFPFAPPPAFKTVKVVSEQMQYKELDNFLNSGERSVRFRSFLFGQQLVQGRLAFITLV